MNALILEPISHLSGTVNLPGSKSISNRALLLASLASGTTRIRNLMDGEDGRFMLEALHQLGIPIKHQQGVYSVTGQAGPLVTSATTHSLYLGLAGTAIRPLAAALTLGKGEFVLDGEPRMRERPIGHLIDALTPLGARVDYLGEAGYPPLKVHGTGLKGGRTSIDGTLSSQFLTSLLLAAPLASEPVEIQILGDLVSRPYIDITLDLMNRFGVRVDHHNYQQFHVPAGGYESPGDYLVEGDASSATYFLAAGAISGPGVTVTGIGSDSLQGDVKFVDVLARMGARVDKQGDRMTVRPGPLKGIVADLNDITDAAMTIAVVALFAQGPTEIRNIYNWRVKETDRLSAMATELRKLGATIIEGRDFIHITPPEKLCSAAIDTYGDHRIAMCFSLAALAGVSIQINNPECVAKTFPDYFQVFRSLAA